MNHEQREYLHRLVEDRPTSLNDDLYQWSIDAAALLRELAQEPQAEPSPHLAGNARIGELHDELAATDLRSADHLRKAIKAEAEVALLRAALNGGNVIERLQFALQRLADAAEALGVNNFGEDWRSDEVQELQAATHAARLVLGPNVRAERPQTAAPQPE